MSFVVSTGKIPDSKKVGEIYVKGNDVYVKGNNLSILKGGTFLSVTDEDIFNKIHLNGINQAKEIKGEFFCIFYDNESGKIYIANDKLGRETLFYYHSENNFILSDDFWEIVNIIEPKASDIDPQSVSEYVFFYRPLFYRTIIKNLNFFPPASIGEFSLRGDGFKLSNYWDFRYDPDENLDMDTAVERLDKIFDNTLKQIKEKYAPGTVFGFGLSGGQDSRLIPHYALKNGMTLKSFIIGEAKPHKLLLSIDHSSAQKIAELYGLHLTKIEYDCESFESKSYYELRHTPLAPARFFQTIKEDKFPEFDVYLTGMNGNEFFGSDIPANVAELSKKELTDSISAISTPYTYGRSGYLTKIIKGFKYLFGIGFTDNVIIPENEKILKARSKIQSFVETELGNKKSNMDIKQKYTLFLISMGKYGSYGMLGEKPIYSIFSNVMEESVKWKPDFLLNRKLQRYYFNKKIPDLAKIPGQDFLPPISDREKKSRLQSIFYIIRYYIRGRGALGYGAWARRKEYLDFSRNVLLKDNEVFKQTFDVEDIINSRDPPHENLVKIKMVLDLIQANGYKDFYKK